MFNLKPAAVGAAFLGTAATMTLTAASAQAATFPMLSFDDVEVAGGTLTYAGEGGSLVGTDLLLDEVTGLYTPLNQGVDLSCLGCTLDFVTGDNISESPNFIFGTGGTVTISGSILTSTGTLLVDNDVIISGTFTENIVGTAIDGLVSSFFGIGINDVNDALSGYYGVDADLWEFATTNISLGDVEVGVNGSILASVTNTDFDTMVVPEPLTILGAGTAIAFGGAFKRKLGKKDKKGSTKA